MCPVVATSRAASDPGSARRLGRASIGVSVAGIVVAILIAIIVGILVASTPSSLYCNYRHIGTCYRYKDFVGSYGYCSGVQSGNFCYHD